jgi:hypothetical protein
MAHSECRFSWRGYEHAFKRLTTEDSCKPMGKTSALRYPIVQALLSPFRRSQQKTLALVLAAIAERAQANSVTAAGHSAVELGTQLGSALTRFYRLLRNPRIDVWMSFGGAADEGADVEPTRTPARPPLSVDRGCGRMSDSMLAIHAPQVLGTAGNLRRLPARSRPSPGLGFAQDGIVIDFIPSPNPAFP